MFSTDLSVFVPLLRSQMLFRGYKNVLIIVYILKLCTLSGLPHFFMCSSQRVQNCSLACSPYTSITVYITPILGQLHWLPADARISCNCMPLFHRCYLFHSCLSLWTPTTVLSFLITSLLCRHPSPATPTLLVRDGRGLCIFSFGPFVRSSLPLHIRNATTVDTF